MIPFCRTPQEADRVLAVMAGNGLTRGQNGLRVYVMAEIPASILLAERFDGFSIGSNDLTQLTLGVDRDSDLLAHLFDERKPGRHPQHRDSVSVTPDSFAAVKQHVAAAESAAA
ncbi:putative PEP-binding protein [Kitasatospora sp. NPDC001664]